MAELLDVVPFLSQPGTLYDVRSPGEFFHACLPEAQSLPLFSDAERAIVGTLYKKQGKEAAILKGLQLASPKLYSFAETALRDKKEVRLYCFRGGMRSQSVGWLFEFVGKKVSLLSGGYKAFRKFSLEQLEKPWQFQVLGGLTGSGKTAALESLSKKGHQVLNLEKLASHRGSAFGFIGQEQQPTNEAFENGIALELLKMNPRQPIWVEDESRMIGTCKIPDSLFARMQKSPFFFLESPLEKRVAALVKEYGAFPRLSLIEATKRITKKLGSKKTLEAIQALQNEDLECACKLLLEYYDAAYLYNMKKREIQWTPFSNS